MSGTRFSRDETSFEHLARHLRACDRAFVPPLSERLDIGEYAIKLVANATRFEAWLGDDLTGLVAVYCNSPSKETAFITNVSVLVQQQGKGIAADLLNQCFMYVRNIGFINIELEVDNRNETAIALYKRFGFVSSRITDNMTTMTVYLEKDAR